jgi:bifunctional non-homologous end joining protein LigD
LARLQTNAVAGSKFAPVALQPLVTSAKPIAERVPDEARTTWVCPKLVAEVKLTEWTDSGEMRHPFLGLRSDKGRGEVIREV